MKYWRAPATGRINWARMYEGFIEPAPPVPELAMFPPVLVRAAVRLVPTKQKEVIRQAVRDGLTCEVG